MANWQYQHSTMPGSRETARGRNRMQRKKGSAAATLRAVAALSVRRPAVAACLTADGPAARSSLKSHSSRHSCPAMPATTAHHPGQAPRSRAMFNASSPAHSLPAPPSPPPSLSIPSQPRPRRAVVLEHAAQGELGDLAGGGVGDLLHKHHVLRHPPARDAALQVPQHALLAGALRGWVGVGGVDPVGGVQGLVVGAWSALPPAATAYHHTVSPWQRCQAQACCQLSMPEHPLGRYIRLPLPCAAPQSAAAARPTSRRRCQSLPPRTPATRREDMRR